jgi:bacteriocin biosynthesis cyclodehydratase domain-containing protein
MLLFSKRDIVKDPTFVFVLHPALEVVALADGRFQLRGLNDNLTFEDSSGVIALLFARCDGMTHAGEILVHLYDDRQQEQFVRLISLLYQKGMLVKATEAFQGDPFLRQVDLLGRQVSGYFDSGAQGHYPFGPVAVSELPSVTVALFGKGILFNAAASLLTNWGIKIVHNPDADFGGPKSMALVCSDVDDRIEMLRLNAKFIAAGTPALYACVSEYLVRIGPLVVPGASACFECYDRRVRSLLFHADEFDAFIRDNHHKKQSETGSPMMAGGLGGFLVASTLIKFVCGVPHLANVGDILELNVISNKMSVSSVLKLPRCHVCGAGSVNRVPTAVRSRR